jgi:hypothetical protein
VYCLDSGVEEGWHALASLWLNLRGAETFFAVVDKIYPHFPFVCNILPSQQGKTMKTLHFGGVFLARDVLSK